MAGFDVGLEKVDQRLEAHIEQRRVHEVPAIGQHAVRRLHAGVEPVVGQARDFEATKGRTVVEAERCREAVVGFVLDEPRGFGQWLELTCQGGRRTRRVEQPASGVERPVVG